MSLNQEIQIRPAERGHRLTVAAQVPRDVDTVFEFFSDAGNLDLLTPSWLHFAVLTPDLSLHQGALIDYKLRVRGLPIRWQSEITTWEPPQRFVDEQRRGPYKWWIHEHRFEPNDDGTLVIDDVHYGVPLGGLLHGLFIKRDLRRIFEHRSRTLSDVFR